MKGWIAVVLRLIDHDTRSPVKIAIAKIDYQNITIK